MIIINMSGGLGNQMFIYALGRALSLNYGDRLYINMRSFNRQKIRTYMLDEFNISPDVKFLCDTKIIKILFYIKRLYYRTISKIRRTDFSNPGIIEKYAAKGYFITDTPKFVYPVYAHKLINYYCGIVLSDKIFEKYKGILIKEFTPKTSSAKFKNMGNYITEEKFVCVHIRRTDYLKSPVHNVCGPGYYTQAILKMKAKAPDSKFLFFSDDIEWVKQNFVEENYYYFDMDFEDYEQMLLMSKCRHFIICNSTFSWWAQYLNKNEDKIVLAPSRWFNDLPKPEIYDDKWILIDP